MSEEAHSPSSEPFHASRVDLCALADTLDQKGQHEKATQLHARAKELEKHPDADVQSARKLLNQWEQEEGQKNKNCNDDTLAHLESIKRKLRMGVGSRRARDWLPELSIPGRGHADFSLEGFVKGYCRFIAEKLRDLFRLDIALEQAGCSVHAPLSEIRDRGFTHKTGKASGEDGAGESHLYWLLRISVRKKPQ